LNGQLPKEIHFHINRIAIEALPTDEEALKSFLIDLWREKDVYCYCLNVVFLKNINVYDVIFIFVCAESIRIVLSNKIIWRY
jgi:hypothetical protein